MVEAPGVIMGRGQVGQGQVLALGVFIDPTYAP